jgi:hypothetical protein
MSLKALMTEYQNRLVVITIKQNEIADEQLKMLHAIVLQFGRHSYGLHVFFVICNTSCSVTQSTAEILCSIISTR